MINLKNNFIIFYIFMLFLILSGVIFLYLLSNNTLKDTTKEILRIEVLHAQKFSKNIDNKIKKIIPNNLYQSLKKNIKLRDKINNLLSIISNTQYRYVYIIQPYKNGYFRYLADGSIPIQERGEWMQKFDPMSNIWQKIVKTKKPQYTIQKNIDNLWITYLYPIKYQNNLEGILAFDISTKEYNSLEKIMQPVKNLLFIMLILLFFIIVFIIFQTFIYLKQRKKTIIDTLTHLYNRSYLEEITKNIDLNHCAIAIADIDNFKKINDTYGHKVGDIVLETVAKRLLSMIRTYDIAIRYGGEEFLIIFNKQIDTKTLRYISQRILINVSKQPIRTKEHDIYVTISMGINPIPAKSRSLSDAIVIADKMLYVAKTSGKNRVVIFEDKKEKNILLLSEIRKSMEEDRLKAFYQPIIDIKTKKIIKYEALARIIDEDGTVFLPIHFLSVIKDTNSYRRLSKIMLTHAFETIKKHNVSVSVNFDIDDFFDNLLFDMIQNMIKEHQKYAKFLTIEILENKQILDFNDFVARINVLKNLNIKIAMDDFGSGYSGFKYIATLKPDILKIDGSIVSNIQNNQNMKKILKSIAKLCKSLEITTIAEFVENEGILEILEEYDIDMAQGYLVGKPRPFK